MPRILNKKITYSTRWFDVVAKNVQMLPGKPTEVYYSLKTPEYVCILGLTPQKDILFVSQYRPALELQTLELPSGQRDKGESLKRAALREFSEETGYLAKNLQFLGYLFPDAGRLSSRVSYYFASNCQRMKKFQPEPMVYVKKISQEKCFKMIRDGKLNNALSVSALCLALAKAKLSIKKHL